MQQIDLAQVLASFRQPARFQIELAALIQELAGGRARLIEVGCETAVTTLLLPATFARTAVDLNQRAIALVDAAAASLGQEVSTKVCDMFLMPFAPGSFDLVFNAGVIEHFNQAERTRALQEYARVMSDGGLMVIAFPNHHCPPYRAAYLLRRMLGIWRFPSEFKLRDLQEEATAAGLRLRERRTLSKATIFNWLDFIPPLRGLFRLADRWADFEGYLTVVVFEKAGR